jgi:RimJ/RimL family protein N-acetyltransferase
MSEIIAVIDSGQRLEFAFEDLMRYHGPGSPGGVAVAFKVLERALPLLEPAGPLERRELTIRTAFGGPGARDGFELVTRAVTDDRYVVDPALERPERGRTLERFVFRLGYRDRSATLWLREGFVTDEFIELARTEGRSKQQERRLSALKLELSGRLMSARAAEVLGVDGSEAAAGAQGQPAEGLRGGEGSMSSEVKLPPDPMKVRRANSEDSKAMALLTAAVAEEGLIATEPPVDIDARAQRFAEAIEGSGPAALWVLEYDGRVVGNAGVHETAAAGVLSLGMAILSEARGRGGGRSLLAAALEHARACGAHKLELEVWPDNARAIALYASAGFEVEGIRRHHYLRRDGSLRSALLMARSTREP